ncbi:hypothetical protein [Paraburkholderia kururiensis]|uniref:hypothetical protein n=1 Tax=Paraburkholderia kururiensis TaxID=984307 RepID=UPI0039A60199
MPFTSLRCALIVFAAALSLCSCAVPPTPQSSTLTPEDQARAISTISHFMSEGDPDSLDSVSNAFGGHLYENRRDDFGPHTVSVTYRGFQKSSTAFSIASTYEQTWTYARGKSPTLFSLLRLVMSRDFCLTRDGFRQAFGEQVDRLADGLGKDSALATSKNFAMVAFTDDGSCVKYFDIFRRANSGAKTTATEPH